jgi:hypothetical protein
VSVWTVHALGDAGGAGGDQPALTGDLDHAQPAAAPDRESVEMAEAGDRNPVLATDLDQGLVLARREIAVVDAERDDAHVRLGCGSGHVSAPREASRRLGVARTVG